MRTFFFCSVLALLMLSATSTHAGHANEAFDHGIYVGLGFSLAFENIDEDDIATDYGITASGFDDSWGVDIGGGYHFTEAFALEAQYSGFSEFDSATVDAEVSTFIVQAKFLDRFHQTRPFFSLGLGFMDVDFDLKTSGSGSQSESGLCAKAGVGMDVILTDNIIVGPKVGYVWGFSDVSAVNYLLLSIALDVHF
jgi:hypothetical protein